MKSHIITGDQAANNNSEAIIPYVDLTVVVGVEQLESPTHTHVVDQSLLLNSYSSMNLISNPALLHIIHTVN